MKIWNEKKIRAIKSKFYSSDNNLFFQIQLFRAGNNFTERC
jgi:hypothetical protein